MKTKEIDITGKRFFLLTTWTDGIKELDIVRETANFLVQKNGFKIPKQSKHQFVGESKIQVKEKYLKILNTELVVRMEAVDTTKNRIDQIKALSEEI
jgi:hypothetical protein